MHTLLQEAGYRISGNRADCRNCRGGSRLTVSFTSEVAYCHRCHWTANAAILAKGLGKSVEPLSPEKRKAKAKAARFGEWVDAQHNQVASQYRYLGRMSAIARAVLVRFPDCEPAWCALARFYHSEARLARMLDVLSFEKVSPWLETPTTPINLFQKWEVSDAR
jgi:hypothetical protein